MPQRSLHHVERWSQTDPFNPLRSRARTRNSETQKFGVILESLKGSLAHRVAPIRALPQGCKAIQAYVHL